MSWNSKDIPNLAGRVAVVTGANGGLGFETARALVAAQAHVVMAVRNAEKTAKAIAQIRTTNPNASLEVVSLDLSSLAHTRDAAAAILTNHDTIDILVNNAGVMALPELATVDGFEMQLGVNHLAHFVLTARLLPAIERAGGRIVAVTSVARHQGRRIDPANPHLHNRYRPWRAYSQSKLANYHFAIGLHQRLSATGSPAISLLSHPGLTHTDLQQTSYDLSHGLGQWLSRTFVKYAAMSTPYGASSQIRAATDPRAKSGELYGPRFGLYGPPVRRPILRRVGMEAAIDALWDVSERETGETFRFHGVT